jgi:Holliday junction resolvase RusA-like endonuclease
VTDAAEAAREPVLTVWSGLRPIPKGSLYHRGNGVLAEDNRRSKPHKDALVLQLRVAVARQRRRIEFPLRCPVEVHLAFFFARPRAAGPLDRPSTVATGDIDKLSRLVLDALTQSGSIRDDSLVVDLAASAWYDARVGTRITVGPARGNDGARLPGRWPASGTMAA